MCLAQGPQRSDAGEARTRGPSVLVSPLSHCAPSRMQVKFLLYGQTGVHGVGSRGQV